jgi:threonine/homoserine/homoserine lactone efflux protein
MPSLSAYLVFLATALAILLVPGPAVLYVVTRSIEMGRAGGIASVAGITTATAAYVVLATAGSVAERMRGTNRIAWVQRWVGGSVLVGLGVLSAAWSPSR